MSKLKIWCPTSAKSLGDMVKGVDYDLFDNDPELIKGTTILCCCNKPLVKRIAELGLISKGRTVGSLRGKPFQFGEATGFITYSPGLILFEPRFATDIRIDVLRADRFVRQGNLDAAIGHYEYTEDLSDAVRAVEANSDPIPLAVDLETLGLDEYHEDAYIISVQVSWKIGDSIVVRFDSKEESKAAIRVWQQLDWLLNSQNARVRGANLKYDLRWLHVHCALKCTNYSMDTTLVGSLLNENRSNSLENHTWIYAPELGGYDSDLNAGFDKGRMDLVPLDIFLNYSGGDTDAVLRISNAQIKELSKDPALLNFYTRVLHPASYSFLRMENTGLLVDKEYMQGFQVAMELEIEALREKALPLIPEQVRKKHNEEDLNLTKQSFVRDLFFRYGGREKTKKFNALKGDTRHKKYPTLGWGLTPILFTEKEESASTKLDHIREVIKTKKQKELFALIESFSKASKTLSTYIVGFLAHLKSDGRYHPSYMLFKNEEEGGTSCLTKDAVILTNRGALYITEVRLGDLVLTHKGKWKPVIGLVLNGKTSTVKVTFTDGVELTCTLDHKFLVEGQWIEAQYLKVGGLCASYLGKEVWRSVQGWPYVVSNYGRVKHRSKTFIRKTHAKGRWGHREVTLARGDCTRRTGNKKDFPIHRLVLDAFEGIHGPEVRHIDGKAWNNFSCNLTSGTTQDAIVHGTTSKVGEPQTKLTWEIVEWLRSLDSSHLNNAQAARKLVVSRELVRDVRNNKRWDARKKIDFSYPFTLVKVVSVVKASIQRTYDITIEDDHSYVANGKITHNTGRPSCRNPGAQTIPKRTIHAKSIRRGIIAPEGKVLVQVDFSQGELKITACVANETNMIRAYQSGIDLHSTTGYSLGQVSPLSQELLAQQMLALKFSDLKKWEKFRHSGKTGNFGLIYKISPLGYQAFAKKSGQELTLDFCERAHHRFLYEMYPRLPEWHIECIEFVKEYGYIRSPLGRVRHLPQIYSPSSEVRSKAGRQAINSPVQATLSDMNNLAVSKFERMYPDAPVQFCGTVYDSGLSYQPEDSWEVWTPRLKEVMENLPLKEYFGWEPQLQFTVDVEVGTNLANLKEVEI